MISALSWIRQGVAAEEPKKQELDDTQYQEIMSKVNEELEQARLQTQHSDDEMAEDTQQEDEEQEEEDSDYEGEDADAVFKDVSKLTMKDEIIGDGVDEEEEEDKEDLHVLPTDRLIVCGRTEDEVSYLDVHVYEEADDNLYVHHDLMLPTFPLCVQPINSELAEGFKNFVAVGTFDPDIEIWNLDVLEAAFPHIILKGVKRAADKKDKKKSKSSKEEVSSSAESGGHSDAVLSLAWSATNSRLLLSASADKSIKLWDLQSAAVVQTYVHHSDKVQSVQWCPHKPNVFASTSYDRKVVVVEMSDVDASPVKCVVLEKELPADPEALAWDPHHPGVLAVSLEDGTVRLYSTLTASLLYTVQAHERACTSLSFNPFVPGLFLTGSVDKTIKLWSVGEDEQVKVLLERELALGKVFAASFCGDTPWLMAAAGSHAEVKVMRLMDWPVAKEFINTKLQQLAAAQ